MSQPASAGRVNVEETDQAVVVHVQAKVLDETSIQQMLLAIDSAAAQSPQKPVIMDLAQVEFLPSLCLGALVQMSNKCKGRTQKLKLAAVRPSLRKVFIITRLDRVFEICDSVEAATRLLA